MPNITDLIPVPVHGHTLYVANDELPLVPLRPICQALGIDFRVQQRKLSGHPNFAPCVVMMTTHDTSGRLQGMLCMPADTAMGWLMTIHPDKVAAKVRTALIAFQRTASRLLYEAWAAVRAGLPYRPAEPMQGEMFRHGSPDAWLGCPSVREAVLLCREAEALKAVAGGRSRALRSRARHLVKRMGMRAAHLNLLVSYTILPEMPAQPALPLEG